MNKIHPAGQMAIDSAGLRAIADYLDDRNFEWQREIQATIDQSPIENLVLRRLQ